MCILPHNFCNSKTGVSQTFTWSNEPWYKEANFRGYHKNIDYPVVLVTTYTENAMYRNVKVTFRGNHGTLGYPSCNGYYKYWTY